MKATTGDDEEGASATTSCVSIGDVVHFRRVSRGYLVAFVSSEIGAVNSDVDSTAVILRLSPSSLFFLCCCVSSY